MSDEMNNMDSFDPEDELNALSEGDIIEMIGDDGETISFIFVDALEYEDDLYLALAEPDEDDAVFFLKVEQDEDGNDTMKFAVGSPWYELNEFLVFDSFMAFRFVKTSELGLVFVPLNPEEDNNDKLENILAFWKQRAHEKPVGQKDRRLIWFIIFIALCALKFILKYLKEVY